MRFFAAIGIVLLLALFATRSLADDGVLPVGSDGKPLNLNFEDGTLRDWRATGHAFDGQPVKGDTVNRRRHDMHSGHQGSFWVGTYEVAKDEPTGTLTSVPFLVNKVWASFLVGGGADVEHERVELVNADDGKVFFRVAGRDREDMRRVAVDLQKQQGKRIFIRLVDQASGGWGHINFDDFRLHDQKPAIPVAVDEPILKSDEVKNAGLSPQRAVEEMGLPPGFKGQLVAGEPDVVQPVAFTIDDRGRIWVAEAMNYPQKAPEGRGKDKILIFEDTQGDGHFDKRTVFIEGLNLVSGLEVGFGGVWVGQAPDLLFIPILEGDKAGKPEVVLDGWGYHDTHETINSLSWGPDGWLYGCQGVFTQSKVGKPGAPDNERVPLNACVWRYHPVNKTFEVFAEGGSNQWGIDWNEQGQMFMTCCVIPHLYHVIQGGRYIRQAGPHFDPYTFTDIKTIADHLHWATGAANQWAANNKSGAFGGGHAHCGAMIYLADNWPAEYRNQIFMGNIHGNRMNEDLLERTGSGYVGHHGHDLLLMNDKWSRLINEKYGPDGGVFVIDWYDKQACHLPKPEVWDRSNGRIYKITYGDPKPVKVDLARLSSEELVKLLTSPNEWYVRHARRILQERGANPALAAPLRELALHGKSAAARLRGVWALQATENLDSVNTCRELFKDPDPYVRGWAIQLAAAPHDVWPGILSDFKALAVDDPSPIVRLYLASAVQYMKTAQPWERWEIVEHLAAHGEDAEDHNLPLMDWYAVEPLVPGDVDRAAKLAIASKLPQLTEFIAHRLSMMSDDPKAIAAAVSILEGAQSNETRHRALTGILAGFEGKRSVPMPPNWQSASEKLSSSGDAGIAQQATALATIFGDPHAIEAFRRTAQDSSADVAARQAALQALIGAADPKLPPILQKLVTDPKLAATAVRGLAGFNDPHTPQVLLDAYPQLEAATKLAALNTLASRREWAEGLLDAIDANKLPRKDLTSPTVRALSSLDDKRINDWIAKNWGTVKASDAEKKAQIARYHKLITSQPLAKSDEENGRAIFARTCMQCHALFGAGAKIGPDLTGSNRANPDYLLENIVDPSAVIGKDYLMTTIQLKDGRLIDGIIKAETADTLTIASVNETLTLPKNEVLKRRTSNVSMMPEGLLAGMTDREVRDLIKYLGSSTQVPMLATPQNVTSFFDGKSLAGWTSDHLELWHVENGQIVGKAAQGIKHNNFLFSDLSLGDFRFIVQLKLTPNEANSGIQFRSIPWKDGEAKGYQADVGKGWWGKIYEESARGLLTKEGGEKWVKPNDWNTYEILAVGHHVRTVINGHLCSEINDPDGALRGQIGFQIHSGGPTDVRYKDFSLELNPKDELKTVVQ